MLPPLLSPPTHHNPHPSRSCSLVDVAHGSLWQDSGFHACSRRSIPRTTPLWYTIVCCNWRLCTCVHVCMCARSCVCLAWLRCAEPKGRRRRASRCKIGCKEHTQRITAIVTKWIHHGGAYCHDNCLCSMAKEQADCTSADNRGEGRIFSSPLLGVF